MYYIFVSGELVEPHRSAGVIFLRGYAHLTAKSEFSAVGEARGRVYVHRRAVDSGGKGRYSAAVGADYCLAVMGGVKRDMLDSLVHAVHRLYGEDVVEKFGVEVAISGLSRLISENGKALAQCFLDKMESYIRIYTVRKSNRKISR